MSNRIKVVCLECGKKFQTASMLPTCPKCKGSDIEPADKQERLHEAFPFAGTTKAPVTQPIPSGVQYRVVTRIPYFNHTKYFPTFDSMHAWVMGSTGVDLPAAPEAAALGEHKRPHGLGVVIVEAVH